MNFGDAVRTCLNNYVTLSGRARRSEFWYFFLFQMLMQFAAGVLDAAILGGSGAVGMLVSLGLLLPSIAVAVRRLHDTGRSGWWLLIALVPLIGWIVLVIFYVGRGEDGPNRFGADPRGTVLPGGPARPWQATPR
ncbi:DUF805 domain-containing protein [Falsiroseomonas sp. CW058]|uniref:DUF805 domain-containing protein n=1 Tax=Falsiroseomonas sp. CW058 TaxID=3388664 RepID=UPI003D31D0AF